MSHRFSKKAFLFATFLALMVLFVPHLSRICEASTKRAGAVHPCCREKAKCGPQFNSQSCCRGSDSLPNSSPQASQAQPDSGKYFPLLSLMTPGLQGLDKPSEGALFKTIAAYSIPPPFLSHHAFLC